MMVSLIIICIILIGGSFIQKIKANRKNPNKISFVVPAFIACFICAIISVAFGFILFEDFPFLLVIVLIFAGIEICVGFSFLSDEKSQTKDYQDADCSNCKPIPWWVWVITAYGIIHVLILLITKE